MTAAKSAQMDFEIFISQIFIDKGKHCKAFLKLAFPPFKLAL